MATLRLAISSLRILIYLRTGKRRAAEIQKKSQSQERRWVFYTKDAKAFEDEEMKDEAVAKPTPQLEDPRTSRSQVNISFCTANQEMHERYWTQLKMRVANGAAHNLHSSNLLLEVTQSNVVRAMLANAASMGLTMDILSEEIVSCFNIAGPVTLCLPPSLRPSSSQKHIIHHPWIDLVPITSFRNSLLSNIGKYDDEELCGDLYGLCGSSREIGLLVWGEAWDPLAYEVSEQLIKKWGWILTDCPELLESTNLWREKRGEKRLPAVV